MCFLPRVKVVLTLKKDTKSPQRAHKKEAWNLLKVKKEKNQSNVFESSLLTLNEFWHIDLLPSNMILKIFLFSYL